MDYTVEYIFKQSNINEDGDVLLFNNEDIHYLLHWYDCCLQVFTLREVSPYEKPSLQEVIASRKNQQFTPNYQYFLNEKISVVCYNEETNSIIILNVKGGISIITMERILKK